MMVLKIAPSPAGTRNAQKITPVATMRNLTQAETASEISESIKIQTAEQNTIGTTIHRCVQIQPSFANPAWRENRSKPGTQVTEERSRAIAAHFPSTYSGRLNGRLRNRGSAPFTRSPATKVGQTQQLNRYDSCVCITIRTKKNLLSTANPPAARSCTTSWMALLLTRKM